MAFTLKKNKLTNMNCKQYQDFTPIERITFIGRLIIAAQQSEMLFDEASNLIAKADAMGIYKITDVNLEHTSFDNLNEVI